MTFWILTCALTVAVAALLILVLLRQQSTARSRSEYDIAVYRDQLASVEKDVARGVIPEDTAERTRLEISRRILEADKAGAGQQSGEASPGLNRFMAALLGLALLAGSFGAYWVLGAPGYGDLPLKARLAASEELRETRPDQAAAERQAAARRPALPEPDPAYLDLVVKLRETVAERPDDARGLQLLAQNEATLGDFAAAHAAQARLLKVLGTEARASDYADYADMLILAAGGYVSPEAEVALGEALKRDPLNGPARYYSGLMFAQIGRADLSFEIWEALLRDSTPDAPWTPAIRAQIEEVALRAGVDFQLPPERAEGLRGPSADDMRAAQDMSPEERMQMIQGMVASLSDRLATEGGSPEEWAQLINALGMLGERDRAQAIWEESLQVFGNDSNALLLLNQTAGRIGLSQ